MEWKISLVEISKNKNYEKVPAISPFSKHIEEINTLIREGWPLKAVWVEVCEKYQINRKYNSFWMWYMHPNRTKPPVFRYHKNLIPEPEAISTQQSLPSIPQEKLVQSKPSKSQIRNSIDCSLKLGEKEESQKRAEEILKFKIEKQNAQQTKELGPNGIDPAMNRHIRYRSLMECKNFDIYSDKKDHEGFYFYQSLHPDIKPINSLYRHHYRLFLNRLKEAGIRDFFCSSSLIKEEEGRWVGFLHTGGKKAFRDGDNLSNELSHLSISEKAIVQKIAAQMWDEFPGFHPEDFVGIDPDFPDGEFPINK